MLVTCNRATDLSACHKHPLQTFAVSTTHQLPVFTKSAASSNHVLTPSLGVVVDDQSESVGFAGDNAVLTLTGIDLSDLAVGTLPTPSLNNFPITLLFSV